MFLMHVHVREDFMTYKPLHLDEGMFTIGTMEESSLYIPKYKEIVKPMHAQITVLDGVVHIKNFDPIMGTFVNNVRIEEEVKLKLGDIISLGHPIYEPRDIENPFMFTLVDSVPKEEDEPIHKKVRLSKANYNEMHESLGCSTCMNVMTNAYSIPCGHTFCGFCLFRWMNYNRSCSICRQKFYAIPTPSIAVDDIVKMMVVPYFTPKQKKWYKERRAIWKRKVNLAKRQGKFVSMFGLDSNIKA